jgi:hypothetical protein
MKHPAAQPPLMEQGGFGQVVRPLERRGRSAEDTHGLDAMLQPIGPSLDHPTAETASPDLLKHHVERPDPTFRG